MADQEDQLSAQVVLWPADRTVDVDEPITSETVGRHLPDPSEAEAVRRALVEEGFAVGPLVGIGFSIAASRSVFLAVFGPGVDRAQQQARRGQQEGLGLDVAALPATVASAVRAVELTPPPAFGPGAP